MATTLQHLVVDAIEPAAQARFWAAALGWEITLEEPDEIVVEPVAPEPGLPLIFGIVPERKSVKNRIHLDLASTSTAEQLATVERLVGLGAVPVDIGQGDLPWVVLVDPEGNEFCVLEPRNVYQDAGKIAAVVVDAADPERLAEFWSAAAGWPVLARDDGNVALRPPSGVGPWLEFLPSTDPKSVKHRLHLDVAPPLDADQAAEVARLLELGARTADVGQTGNEPWVVLADPEGGEFCVLTPR